MYTSLSCIILIEIRKFILLQLFCLERLPNKNDMKELVYCMATLLEIQRISCVAPGSLPHVLTKPYRTHGYNFPEGSIFMANLKKILKDPEVFPNPRSFLPERFISTDTGGMSTIRV